MRIAEDIETPFNGDESAVSPVIAVILMVAITVILAAVIATFVLGVGEDVNDTTPQAAFDFSQQNETFEYSGATNETTVVTIVHETGDVMEGQNLRVTVDGQQAWDIDKTGDIGSKNDPARKPADVSQVSSGTEMRVVIPQSGGVQDGDDIGITGSELLINTDNSNSQVKLLEEGDTVRVIYDKPGTDETAILGSYEVT